MSKTYLEDIPSDTPEFNYKLVAKALSPLLDQPSTGAMVVGIHGPWGSGKTTLMRELERELKAKFADEKHIFIQFNAWKYQEKQALWRALILRVIGELGNRTTDKKQLEELEASLYSSFEVEEKGPWKVSWRALIVETFGILLSLVKLDFVGKAIKESGGFVGKLLSWGAGSKKEDDEESIINKERVEKLASVLERTTVQRQVVQVQSIEQFLDKFAKVIEPATHDGRRLFVFIDDLDRCLPESALEIFEAIKLFLDAPGCGYVVALDRDVIRKGLAVRYSQQSGDGGGLFIDPDEYIEKTISVSYDLPRLSESDTRAIVRKFELPLKLTPEHEQLILVALGPNPRRVKRFMNTLSVQLQLAQLVKGSGATIEGSLIAFDSDHAPQRFKYFLKLALLSYKYSGLFSLVLKDPEVLRRLQRLSAEFRNSAVSDPGKARSVRNQALDTESALMAGLKTEEEFWSLMATSPGFLEDESLTKQLLSWFRQVEPAAKP